MGDYIYVKGKRYRVEDKGNLNKHGNIIDIFFDSPRQVDRWGRRHVNVYKKKKQRIVTTTIIDELPKNMCKYVNYKKSREAKRTYTVLYSDELEPWQVKVPDHVANNGSVQIGYDIYEVVGTSWYYGKIIMSSKCLDKPSFVYIDMVFKKAVG